MLNKQVKIKIHLHLLNWLVVSYLMNTGLSIFVWVSHFFSNYNIDVILAMASFSTETSLVLVLACFVGFVAQGLTFEMPMPGVRCPRCAERGIEQWVLPGKHCPRCNQPC